MKKTAVVLSFALLVSEFLMSEPFGQMPLTNELVLASEFDQILYSATNGEDSAYAKEDWRIGVEYLKKYPQTLWTNQYEELVYKTQNLITGVSARVWIEFNGEKSKYENFVESGSWWGHCVVVSTNTMAHISNNTVLDANLNADDGKPWVSFTDSDGNSKTNDLILADKSYGIDHNSCVGSYGWRADCTTNLLNRLMQVDTSVTSVYPLCMEPVQGAQKNWVAPNALQLYNGGDGNYGGIPTSLNENFFWPELATNLLVSTAAKVDTGTIGAYTMVVFVAPHYAIGAAHAGHWGGIVITNLSPFKTMWTQVVHGTLPNGKSYNWGAPTTTRPSSTGDISVVRFNDPVPSNRIARLLDYETLNKLTKSFPRRWTVLCGNCHSVYTPGVLSDSYYDTTSKAESQRVTYANKFVYTGYDSLYDYTHKVHYGDSGTPVYLIGPRAQVIPVYLVFQASTTRNQGPSLVGKNVDFIDDVIRRDSDGQESVWRWTEEELR